MVRHATHEFNASDKIEKKKKIVEGNEVWL